MAKENQGESRAACAHPPLPNFYRCLDGHPQERKVTISKNPLCLQSFFQPELVVPWQLSFLIPVLCFCLPAIGTTVDEVQKCIGGGIGIGIKDSTIEGVGISGEFCENSGDGDRGKCLSLGLPKSEA